MKISIEPYRLFFITGAILAFYGAFIWIFFYYQAASYPVVQHPAVMVGGFLLSFVCGFIMTAAPKFTGTLAMTSGEGFWMLSLNVATLITAIFFSEPTFYFLNLMTFISLFVYFLGRFKNRKQNPPPSFVFIGLGLMLGTMGSTILLIDQFANVPSQTLQFAKLIYYQGYILSLIVGVGSRLIPALLGHLSDPMQKTIRGSVKGFYLLMVLFLFSYIIEAFVDVFSGSILKSAVLAFVAFFYWKIHQLPKNKTRLSWAIIIAAWMMVLGITGSAWNAYRIHFLHLFLIGGLGLMTFMIAVRVILAHGGHGLELESKSKMIPTLLIVLIITALTRFSAGFLPKVYLSHLMYASVTWCLAVVLWSLVFVPKIIRKK